MVCQHGAGTTGCKWCVNTERVQRGVNGVSARSVSTGCKWCVSTERVQRGVNGVSTRSEYNGV